MKKRTYQASDTAKREICAALKGLMAQKPLTKISVTEIMRACGMARQHFYYHFEDIYDAVRWFWPLIKLPISSSASWTITHRSKQARVN